MKVFGRRDSCEESQPVGLVRRFRGTWGNHIVLTETRTPNNGAIKYLLREENSSGFGQVKICLVIVFGLLWIVVNSPLYLILASLFFLLGLKNFLTPDKTSEYTLREKYYHNFS